MELTLITVFLGIIAACEVVAVILNSTNSHLAEELRTAEKQCVILNETPPQHTNSWWNKGFAIGRRWRL